MPTPIGHSLTGLAVWAVMERPASIKNALNRKSLWWAAVCVVVANTPDLDFILWTQEGLTFSGRYHHGVTHSIGFALAFATAAWLWARLRAPQLAARAFGVTLSCYALHVGFDLLYDDSYPVNGIGLPALWPVSDTYYLLAHLPPANRADPFSPESLAALGIEIVLCGGFLAAATLLGRRLGRPAADRA